MWDQQRLKPACAYAQTDQSLYWSLKYSMTVKLLAEHQLRFLSLMEAAQARLNLNLSKCHIVGNHMSRLNFAYNHFYSMQHVLLFRGARDQSFGLCFPLFPYIVYARGKVLVRLPGCAGPTQPMMFANVISTKNRVSLPNKCKPNDRDLHCFSTKIMIPY